MAAVSVEDKSKSVVFVLVVNEQVNTSLDTYTISQEAREFNSQMYQV